MNFGLAVDFLVVAMPVVYVILAGVYGLAFFRGDRRAEQGSLRTLVTVVLLHVLYVGLRTAEFDHPPVTTVFEIMTMLSLCISVAYLYIEMRTKTASTGFFIILLAFLFQTASSLFIRDAGELPPILRSNLLGFHVSSALLGYTAISLSAVYGFLYLLLYREIRTSRLGLIYSRLPNLETLEKMSYKSMTFGFVMITVAITVGLFWLPRAFPSFSYWDGKLIGTLIVWLLYGSALGANRALGWQGRKTIMLSLVAFGCLIVEMSLINTMGDTFHSFR